MYPYHHHIPHIQHLCALNVTSCLLQHECFLLLSIMGLYRIYRMNLISYFN